MENITDEKKGKSIEQNQVPYASIIPFGNILERTAFGKDLTQSVLQSFTQMTKPVFSFSQFKELYQKTGSSDKNIESQADEQ